MVLVLSLLLAAPDAGPPLRVDAGVRSVDAGTSEPPAAADSKVKALEHRVGEVSARADEASSGLKKRVSELETKVGDLERQLRTADTQAKRTADELAAFKKEVNEREEQRREAERRAGERRQRFESATKGLVSADQQLASGSVAQVNELIRQAEESYSGPALQYVQAAKAALANNDLGGARRYLLLAVLEGQFNRP